VAFGPIFAKKKTGAGAETLPQQVINNSAAVQQKKCGIWLYECCGKFILAAMYFRRVGTQVSTAVTPPAPAAQNLGVGRRQPCSADV